MSPSAEWKDKVKSYQHSFSALFTVSLQQGMADNWRCLCPRGNKRPFSQLSFQSGNGKTAEPELMRREGTIEPITFTGLPPLHHPQHGPPSPIVLKDLINCVDFNLSWERGNSVRNTLAKSSLSFAQSLFGFVFFFFPHDQSGGDIFCSPHDEGKLVLLRVCWQPCKAAINIPVIPPVLSL